MNKITKQCEDLVTHRNPIHLPLCVYQMVWCLLVKIHLF